MSNKNQITNFQIEHAYRTKGALVLRRCQLILRNEEEAKDAFHEAFRRLLKYDVRIETDHISLSFLYRVAERCCFDLLKKRKPSVSMDDTDVHTTSVHGFSDRNEAFDGLTKFFLKLNKTMKHIALLYFVDGLTQEQIAVELGYSRKTIGKKINQLKKIAEKIKKE